MIVGAVAGLVAQAFISMLYGCEGFFDRLRIPDYVKPVVGGLLVGAMGICLPQVFGVGYDTINGALAGREPAALLAILLVAKMVATSVTLASGGSGAESLRRRCFWAP